MVVSILSYGQIVIVKEKTLDLKSLKYAEQVRTLLLVSLSLFLLFYMHFIKI